MVTYFLFLISSSFFFYNSHSNSYKAISQYGFVCFSVNVLVGLVCIFWILTLFQIHGLQAWSPVYYVTFSFVSSFLCCTGKLCSLILRHLFISSFVGFGLMSNPKKSQLTPVSGSLPLLFSSKSFMVSDLMPQTLVHFWIFFCV